MSKLLLLKLVDRTDMPARFVRGDLFVGKPVGTHSYHLTGQDVPWSRHRFEVVGTLMEDPTFEGLRVRNGQPPTEEPTKGHCAGNGGLRGHSVGDLFPVVLYQRGNPHEVPLTHWMRLPSGHDIGPFPTFNMAAAAATYWKDNEHE